MDRKLGQPIQDVSLPTVIPTHLVKSFLEKFAEHIIVRWDGCWIWLGQKTKAGYGVVIFGRTVLAHRFSWELFNGKPIPEGLLIRHTCATPLCINPSHLVPGTHKENMWDARHKIRAGVATLTEEKVEAILRERNKGASYGHLEKKYKIGHCQLARIIRGSAWPDVYARVGLTPPVRLSTRAADYVKDLIADRKTGMSVNQLVKKYNRSKATIRKHLNKGALKM